MISFSLQFFQLFILFSAFVYGIVDSNTENGDLSLMITNQTEELCSHLYSAKRALLADFQRFQLFANCDVSANCSSLSCRILLEDKKVKAGVNFRLCQPSRAMSFWMNTPKTKWSYSFPIPADKDNNIQRVEIKRILNVRGLEYSDKRWFIKLLSNLSRDESSGEEYLSLLSSLQICETRFESSCENKTLINVPRLSVGYLCDVSSRYLTDEELLLKEESDGFSSYRKISRRSSRSASWDPENLHSKSNSPTEERDLGVGSSSRNKIGQACDTSDIFVCGESASCVHSKDGQGVCECLKDFVLDSSGVCQKRPADSPVDPPSQPVNPNSSTSAALGALFSVFILLSIAAAVFFGTKYHVFSRLRNRLPLNLRCWPWPVFRRSSPLEDNVSMVNPIDEDDDEPLLL